MSIADSIKELAKTNDPKYSVICKAIEIDENKRVCDCEPINGEPTIFDVRLQSEKSQSKGLVLIPKKDSYVIVSFLSKNECFVSQFSELDKVLIDCENVIFNGGNLDGMVKINDLVSKLNTIEKDLNNLKTVFSGWTPVSQDGGGALKGAVSAWAGATLTETTKQDLENEKVKH